MMNEIINIGVGTDVKLTARLVDAQGNAINLNQVTELRAVIYNGDRQRTLSDYNIVDDTSVEFVLRSGTELTAGDQIAISMAIRYKKDGFVNSTPIIEIIHRGWVGEEITPMAMPMAVVNSAITAQFTISVPPAVYYAGASPRIGANGHWFVFDDVTKDYVDTGFGANLSNEQIISDETERRRQEAIRVAAETQREVRMREVENKVTDIGRDLGYLSESMDMRIAPTPDGVEVKGTDDGDLEVKLSLSTKNLRPKFVRNGVIKELALKDDVDTVSNNKFDKSKVLPAYPSSEPTDDTGVISAKQQYKKDKEQADKMFQLEQDVNIVRGDVQGVRNIDGVNKGKLSQFTISFYISGEYKYGANEFVIGKTSEFAVFAGYNGAPIAALAKKNSVIEYVRSSGCITGLITCSFYNGVIKLYSNAVLVAEGSGFDSQQYVSIIDAGLYASDLYLRDIRFFNTALTQQQVDLLYNQGRVDEIVLNDYYYNNTGIEVPVVKDADNQTNFSKTTNENGFFVLETDVALNSGCRYLTTFNIKKNDGSIPSKIDLYTAYHFGCEQFYYDNTTGDVSYLLSPKDACITLFYPKDLEINTVYNITFFKCKRINVLNEYKPKYLTATKWIDNGVNKQDMIVNALYFTYIRPYKQYSFGSGAPTVPPNAAFVEYTDVDTGRVWKSGGKPSTRQFDLNDYGIIKQGRS